MPEMYKIKLGKKRIQKKTGKRPYIMKHSGPDIKNQCERVQKFLADYSIPDDEDPYADKQGKVKALATLARELAENSEKGTDAIIDKIIDMFGFGEGLPIVVNERLYRKTDELTSAGLVLTEPERRIIDENKNPVIMIQDFFEGIMLAVSVLRRMGFNAYPSFSSWKEGEQEYNYPVISIIDCKSETPLITFNPGDKNHPPAENICILSDETMLGITYLFQAGNSLRKLSAMMSEKMEIETKMLGQDEIDAVLKEIAELIDQAAVRCDIPVFFSKFLGVLEVSDTPRIIDDIPEMHPNYIYTISSNSVIGAFSILYDTYQQVKMIEIINGTSPEHVDEVLNNEGIITGNMQDGLKFALECRMKVHKMYRKEVSN